MKNKRSTAACPECGHTIALAGSTRKGDWITCPHCRAGDIEVLDWAYDGPEIAGSPPHSKRMWGGGDW